ncbi:hypothetical protein ACFM35_04445 [Microbacterium sp. P01]|uniref:hypothetical protein n=1 Tax=Microbacterium sp. P01 TaxID=3366261 RepID=UPI00366D7DFC
MTRPLARRGATLLVAASVFAFTACSSSETPTTLSTESPSPNATSPEPTPSGSGANEPVGDPTCETLIPADTVTVFTESGLTPVPGPFILGGEELADGLQCKWGNAAQPSDHVQVFGWAPITEDLAEDAITDLVAQGWREVQEGDARYVTAGQGMIMEADDQGFGSTYQFGDGWVSFADTKQGLLLVTWPTP